MIKVFKHDMWGSHLIGSMDDTGKTYRGEWPNEREIGWPIDDAGRIYLVFGESQGMIGWVEDRGVVYSQQGIPVSGFYSYPEKRRFPQPPQNFAPAPTFHVGEDGFVHRQEKRGSKLVGKVEGTSDLRTIGALALVPLSWEV